MAERIVATSHPRVAKGATYRVDSEDILTRQWYRVGTMLPDMPAAVAYAKAFGGARWRVVEVVPDKEEK